MLVTRPRPRQACCLFKASATSALLQPPHLPQDLSAPAQPAGRSFPAVVPTPPLKGRSPPTLQKQHLRLRRHTVPGSQIRQEAPRGSDPALPDCPARWAPRPTAGPPHSHCPWGSAVSATRGEQGADPQEEVGLLATLEPLQL